MHQQRHTLFPPVALPSRSSDPNSEVRALGTVPASEQRVRFHAGMTIACADGVLGYVERSLPTWQPHRPTHLVVRTGEQGEHAVIVPVHWTTHVSTDAVRLRVRKRHVARRARYQPFP